MLFHRPLIPCVAAYVAGLWLVHDVYHASAPAALLIGGSIIAAMGGAALWRKDMTPIYLLLIMAVGAVVMGVRERRQQTAQDLIKQLDGPGMHVISGRVRAISELSDTESARILIADIEIIDGSRQIKMPGLMQVYMEKASMAGADDFPVAGELITFPGRVYQPTAVRNFFGYNRLEALRHEQVFSSAAPLQVKGIVRIQQGSGGIIGSVGRSLASFRRQVSENLRRDMWQREGRLMVAMLFNDMRGLTDDERHIFSASQTFHLFAVSGMHVAILALVLNLIFRALRFGVRWSWIGVAIVLLFYLWTVDFVPSATRSYLMLLAFTAGYMLGREVDGITSLALAVAAVIAFDPAAPWKAGFELSVAGVGAIVLFTPLLRSWLPVRDRRKHPNPPPRFVSRSIDVALATIAVAIFLLPLQIYYFGFWNLVSPLANLLQAGLASLVLSAGVLTAALGLLSETAGAVIGQSASAIMRIIYLTSHAAAEADWAIFHFRQMPLWLMLCSYGFLLSGYYIVRRDTPEFRLKSRARFATHTCCALGLLLAFQMWSDWPRPRLEIWALDVGQGDATLIRFPNGQTMLIDGGESDPNMGQYVVLPQLRGLGISELDYIVATHDDEDHTGGLASVIRAVGSNYLLVPEGMVAKSESTQDMLAAAEETHCVVRQVSAGFTAKPGDCLIEILNPLKRGAAEKSDNDLSIVMRISYRKFTALLMADAGLAVEARLINNHQLDAATLLKIGHHGSKSSTGKGFLSAVRPACALVSCGARNNFGHPAKKVMQRLQRTGARILRTDKQGAARITTDGKTVTVETVRK